MRPAVTTIVAIAALLAGCRRQPTRPPPSSRPAAVILASCPADPLSAVGTVARKLPPLLLPPTYPEPV